MTFEGRLATAFAMSEDVWMHHANPWSVWTRFTVLPLLILAIWSRVWLGWWAFVPMAAAVLWMWLNPRIFPKPQSDSCTFAPPDIAEFAQCCFCPWYGFRHLGCECDRYLAHTVGC